MAHERYKSGDPGDYWACNEPERPDEGHAFYWHDCPACALAFRAATGQELSLTEGIYGAKAKYALAT